MKDGLIPGPAGLFIIAGPCVIESEELCLRVGDHVHKLCQRLGLTYVFKASFDKANRTSATSFRGPGLDEGLRVLEHVKKKIGAAILTDIHETGQARPAAEV